MHSCLKRILLLLINILYEIKYRFAVGLPSEVRNLLRWKKLLEQNFSLLKNLFYINSKYFKD